MRVSLGCSPSAKEAKNIVLPLTTHRSNPIFLAHPLLVLVHRHLGRLSQEFSEYITATPICALTHPQHCIFSNPSGWSSANLQRFAWPAAGPPGTKGPGSRVGASTSLGVDLTTRTTGMFLFCPVWVLCPSRRTRFCFCFCSSPCRRLSFSPCGHFMGTHITTTALLPAVALLPAIAVTSSGDLGENHCEGGVGCEVEVPDTRLCP